MVRAILRTLLQIAVFAALAFPALASDRVALLIGNNNYGNSPLRNAVNDARDLGAALKELGFKVIIRENAGRQQMFEAIREFGTAAEGASTAFFFYAGHAMQFRERNYLIPIDIAMGSEEDVTFFAVELQLIFDRMDKARTRFNFIVLDACRDNPFGSSFRVSSSGLAQVSAPAGTMIAYATSPGSTAEDGFQRNGVYTKHILQHIRVPDVPVEVMFRRVREGVVQETLKRQTPWDASSLKGEFVFNSGASRTASPSAPASGPSADVALTVELQFWLSVKDSSRAEEIQAYLDKYPKGTFSAVARSRLDGLTRPTRVASTDAPVMRAAQPTPTPVEPKPAPAEPKPAAAQAVQSFPAAPPPSPGRPASAERAPDKPIVVAAAPATAPPAAPAKPPEPLPGREIAPGIREIQFDEGAVYRGPVRGTKLHGKGEYIAKTFRYKGDFADGVKHGEGVYEWENGNRYEGPFAEDRPHGRGKYFFANGDRYEGEIRAGVLTGRGIYVTKGGDTLEGSFVDAKLHGVGTFRFSTGDRYEGEFLQGRMHGSGRYYTQGGDRIEAGFMDGKPAGKGIYFFANGDRYEGDMRGSELTGQGAYYYSTGLKYEGEVRQAQPQGRGIFWFQDGTRFEGVFENGLARAKGELIRADGSRGPAEIVDGTVRPL